MAYRNLIVSDRGQLRIITFNRPEALNALNATTIEELNEAINDLKDNSSVRCVILTGAKGEGRESFIAGADIKEMKNYSPLQAEYFSRQGHRVFNELSELPMPVIAAVNGFALGGGLELALACDFIYASENALLGLVETDLGLIPGFGGVGRLSRRVGAARAKEYIFSAAKLSASKAKEVNLVNEVVPEGEVVEAAVALGEKIAKKGPYAVQLVKRLLVEGADADLRTANAMEQRAFGLVFGSHDHQIGIESFMEKRKPNFEGR
jgi:enoyl-CoA hydratase